MTTTSPALQVVRGTQASRAALVIGTVLVLIAASMPLWAESSWMREFVEIACYFVFASMWNLLAGSLQAMRTTVAPSDGPLLLLFAFEAVIIGGMGSFWGTFAGAMVLGLAQQIGFRLDPGWGLWFGHLVFLAVLVVRPQGLFPRTRG